MTHNSPIKKNIILFRRTFNFLKAYQEKNWYIYIADDFDYHLQILAGWSYASIWI